MSASLPTDSAESPAVDSFDSYTVVEAIGAGDFADAYKVSAGERELALKWASDRKGSSARLENEIEVLKLLDHKGIPTFFADGEKDDRPYLVMSLAPGHTVQQTLRERAEAGGVQGQNEVLTFIRDLFAILAHIHERGWVHRDVKSANVLTTVSMANTSLIDFGFAKRIGETEIRVDDSFWRAGAARYSPPEKHAHPGKAVPEHDVFAVGVLAYQLLTGEYPWDAPVESDVGELRELMCSTQPSRVGDRNSMVDSDASRLVMGLIEIRDTDRPSAAEALEQVKRLLAEYARRQPAAPGTNVIVYSRVVRDPLFGDVRLTEYERLVLNTPQMQRLRYIKQLGLTNLVYPGAEHTRLSHAIGCVYRTEQMLRSIEDINGVRIERDTRLVSRLFALIHDVTHVGYGHTIEDELAIFERHDRNQKRIERLVLDAKSALSALLSSNPEGQQARAHFDRDASIQQRSAITELVSGSTGADVLDYIDRDAFHCGLDHRIDSAIFRQLHLQSPPGSQEERLISLLYGPEGPRIDREYAVESLLSERYALFLKVYCHKRKHAASALLDKALSVALFGGTKKAGAEIEERDYELLADDVIVDRLRHSNRATARKSAERLVRRELPRGVFRAQLLPEGSSRTDVAYEDRRHELQKLGLFDPKRRLELVRRLARAAQLNADDVFIYCPPKAPGYQRVKHWLSRRPGRDEPADDVGSPLREIKSRHLGLWELWAFCADSEPKAAERLAIAAEDLFGHSNRIDVNPRSDRLF